MHIPYHGLVAAPFTPFKDNLDINLDVIPAYVRFLEDRGVVAAFVCGTTGEGASLRLEERLAVAEHWVKYTNPDFRVIVHTGHTCLEDACTLSHHAAKIGAAAVSCLAPYFFKPDNLDSLVEWCRAVAAAAEPLPFYFYHIPSMTGVDFPMDEFLERAAGKIPTFAGIKFTHNDLVSYKKCAGFQGGRFDILFGRDELLIEGLKNGSLGAVGSTYNFASPLYIRLMEAFTRGDVSEAGKRQSDAIRLIEICCNAGVPYLAAAKAVMPMLGLDCGPVRPPLRNPSPEQKASLREKLEAMDFFALTSPSSPHVIS